MQFSSGRPLLSNVHRLQAHLCFRSVHLHSNAGSCIVECCSRKGPTTRQTYRERASWDHNKGLRQQAGAIAASLLLSVGHACAPAEAYNVRLQDVENKAMQAGMQARKSACQPYPFFSSGLFLEPRHCLHHPKPALCRGCLRMSAIVRHHCKSPQWSSLTPSPGSLYGRVLIRQVMV